MLKGDDDSSYNRITYDIDREKDIINSIEFDVQGLPQSTRGRMEFTYLDEVSGLASQFSEPEVKGPAGLGQSAGPGMTWLFELSWGDLTR